jgi:hypothetical protein
MFRELTTLGECCKVDTYGELCSLMEDMASALSLTPDELLEVDWFAEVRVPQRVLKRAGWVGELPFYEMVSPVRRPTVEGEGGASWRLQ